MRNAGSSMCVRWIFPFSRIYLHYGRLNILFCTVLVSSSISHGLVLLRVVAIRSAVPRIAGFVVLLGFVLCLRRVSNTLGRKV